jgi:hypothetical protein
MQEKHHILDENEIVDGIDELGVLLYGHGKNAYWYGSQLSIEETREVAPYQNATGMQVSSAVLAGMVWALENPNAGITEADEMDFRRCLEVQMPYLGPVIGQYTDWTPLTDRPGLFPEDIDKRDPWQFRNVLVRREANRSADRVRFATPRASSSAKVDDPGTGSPFKRPAQSKKFSGKIQSIYNGKCAPITM